MLNYSGTFFKEEPLSYFMSFTNKYKYLFLDIQNNLLKCLDCNHCCYLDHYYIKSIGKFTCLCDKPKELWNKEIKRNVMLKTLDLFYWIQ